MATAAQPPRRSTRTLAKRSATWPEGLNSRMKGSSIMPLTSAVSTTWVEPS